MGASSVVGGRDPRPGAGLVSRAGGVGAPCRAARCRWPQPLRSAVVGALASRDRASGEQVSADGGRAAAVSFAGGTTILCALRCAGAGRLHGELVLALEGPLDGAALATAVQALMERHGSLRAGFEHENLSRPVQVIVAGVRPPWRSLDLSLLDEAGREERLADILLQDRAERFDLASPPLLRFTLIRLCGEEHRLVLTCHHILLDGWSTAVLVQELLRLYAHKGNAAVLPRVTPYRDYLSWLAVQDRAAAVAAWQDALAGQEEATRLARHELAGALAPKQIMLAVSEQLTTALNEVRRQGLTLNTLIQTAWAILLGRLLGRGDVVFGVTVSGRPPEVAGIERMVGLFINTLPLRIKL